jgi:hypothetical protein
MVVQKQPSAAGVCYVTTPREKFLEHGMSLNLYLVRLLRFQCLACNEERKREVAGASTIASALA